jgi:hypothetical protein
VSDGLSFNPSINHSLVEWILTWIMAAHGPISGECTVISYFGICK